MAVQDLPFRAVGGSGAVGVQDEPPVPAMNANVVMELAKQYTISNGGFAAVRLVA